RRHQAEHAVDVVAGDAAVVDGALRRLEAEAHRAHPGYLAEPRQSDARHGVTVAQAGRMPPPDHRLSGARAVSANMCSDGDTRDAYVEPPRLVSRTGGGFLGDAVAGRNAAATPGGPLLHHADERAIGHRPGVPRLGVEGVSESDA